MSTRLSQKDFADYAAAWGKFIANASASDVQTLFQDPTTKHAQLYVSFDLQHTIMPLLSTVGISLVRTRFVLLPAGQPGAPRFGVVIYAADERGGRISAYYLGTSQWESLSGQLTSCQSLAPSPTDGVPNGIVPFNLAKTWVCNWTWATHESKLDPAMFATSYGLLQGYDFALGDFLDPLFQMQNLEASAVRAIFGAKRYYPAYPENLPQPTNTFELVVRLYSPAADLDAVLGGSGDGSPSYDQSTPNPPGI